MLTILEVNNLWNPAANDARRYHVEKLAFMQGQPDQRYVLVQPDVGTWTQALGRELLIEHVESPIRPGSVAERALVSGRRLRELVQLHRPSVIQCGSPAVLPLLIQLASARLNPRPALIGYWHGDLARELVGPNLSRLGSGLVPGLGARLGPAGERAIWWWSKQGYAGFDAVFVPSRDEARLLGSRGLDRLYHTPLGVDAQLYAPQRREAARVEQLRAGVESRPILWTDADARSIAPIYAELCCRSTHDPALVLAGPHADPEDEAGRQRFASGREHVHAPAWSSETERASWLASCDLGLLLGGATTCAEAMASALPIVAVAGWAGSGAGSGARAGELVREAGCGRTVHDAGPAVIAEALLALAASPERVELGRRGRPWITRFDWPSCFERERVCVAEVLDYVRRGQRVPAGIHERMQTPAIADVDCLVR